MSPQAAARQTFAALAIPNYRRYLAGQSTSLNSTLQLAADPAMRGRVMSLWFVAFQGSTPIGAPAVGAIIATAGPRTGLAGGALACVAAAALGVVAQRRVSGRPGGRALVAFQD